MSKTALSAVALFAALAGMPALAQAPCPAANAPTSASTAQEQAAARADQAAADIEQMAQQLEAERGKLGEALSVLSGQKAFVDVMSAGDATCALATAANPLCAKYKVGRVGLDAFVAARDGNLTGAGAAAAKGGSSMSKAAGNMSDAMSKGADGKVYEALVSTLKASGNVIEAIGDLDLNPIAKSIGRNVNSAAGLVSAGMAAAENATQFSKSADIVATEQARITKVVADMRQRAQQLREKAKAARSGGSTGAGSSPSDVCPYTDKPVEIDLSKLQEKLNGVTEDASNRVAAAAASSHELLSTSTLAQTAKLAARDNAAMNSAMNTQMMMAGLAAAQAFSNNAAANGGLSGLQCQQLSAQIVEGKNWLSQVAPHAGASAQIAEGARMGRQVLQSNQDMYARNC